MVGPSFRRQSVQVKLPPSVQRSSSSSLLGRGGNVGAQHSAWEEMSTFTRKPGASSSSAASRHASAGLANSGISANATFTSIARSRALSGGSSQGSATGIVPSSASSSAAVAAATAISTTGANPPSSPMLSSASYPDASAAANPNQSPSVGASIPPLSIPAKGLASKDAAERKEKIYLSPRIPNRSKAPTDDLFAMPGTISNAAEPVENPKVPLESRKIFFKPTSYLDEQLKSSSGGQNSSKSTSSKLKRSAILNPIFTAADEDAHQNLVNFVDIVDVDEDEAYEDYISEELCGRLLEHHAFRTLLLTIIILNSVLIGVQTDTYIEKKFSSYLSGIDTVFLIVFVVEILLKWYNGFYAFWRDGWNIFDFAIVAASLFGPNLTFISSMRVLRVLRVFRAFRTLRSISALQGLQVIINTIMQSLPDMGNIMALLGIVMFIFSVVGVDVFGETLPDDFGTISLTMFTLFKYLTQDGWVPIYNDLRSKNMGIAGALYSVFFMTIGTFIFINVIVGVTVTNLQDAYTEIKHVRRAKHRKLHRRHAGELQTRPIVKITHIQPDQWRKQIPVEKPKFSNITPSNLENYFLVLSAVEDNLVEFMNLKKEVEEIVSQVRDLNHVPTSEESSDPESELEEIGVLPEDDGDDVQAGPGDVLSAMIRRDAAKEGRSRQQKEKQVRSISV
eukprot:TRINITY_DN2684_c0_g1_i2.p1 TRINITY_DN2684_c0_g1~~TRINITY_DN2684_c0_g1_i2.p1  ORF type:complete len:677 (+),score=155.07 TRINITY_DN2684_c0_g1_i2:55-2085(+)